MNRWFSFSRWLGIVGKEFIQMRRDRLTFAMMIGIPIVQLMLFGFAINSDPKHLPTALLDADRSEFSRGIDGGDAEQRLLPLRRRGRRTRRRGRADAGDRRGAVRGDHPGGLLARAGARRAAGGAGRGGRDRPAGHRQRAGDAGSARAVGAGVANSPGRWRRWRGSRARSSSSPIARYNPEAITQYNIVPGLMGVILTMTMVLITGLAITRERERGTMENLLSTPATPLEVHDRQDRPLHRHRPDPGHADPGRWRSSSSTCRCWAASSRCMRRCCCSSPPT